MAIARPARPSRVPPPGPAGLWRPCRLPGRPSPEWPSLLSGALPAPPRGRPGPDIRRAERRGQVLRSARLATTEPLVFFAGKFGLSRYRGGQCHPIPSECGSCGRSRVIGRQLAQIDIHTLRSRVREVPWAELCASRDFVAGVAELARAMLVPAEHQGAPEAFGAARVGPAVGRDARRRSAGGRPVPGHKAGGLAEWTATAAA
jgi:hypothetical protein